jgi:hypothetical protein
MGEDVPAARKKRSRVTCPARESFWIGKDNTEIFNEAHCVYGDISKKLGSLLPAGELIVAY